MASCTPDHVTPEEIEEALEKGSCSVSLIFEELDLRFEGEHPTVEEMKEEIIDILYSAYQTALRQVTAIRIPAF